MMVNLRLSALGKTDDRLPLASTTVEAERGERGRRAVIFQSSPVNSPIYLRTGLRAGDRVEGPAVIEEMGATILLYPGDKMQVNDFGHLVIDVAN